MTKEDFKNLKPGDVVRGIIMTQPNEWSLVKNDYE